MKSLLLGLLLFSLLNVSCAQKPPDVFVFENLQQHLATDSVSGHLVLIPSPACEAKIGEVECGHGVGLMSGKEIYVGEEPNHLFNKKKWSELKAESIYIPAVESYAPISAYMIDACKAANCDPTVDAFKVKVNSLNGIGAVLSPPSLP